MGGRKETEGRKEGKTSMGELKELAEDQRGIFNSTRSKKLIVLVVWRFRIEI